MRSMRSKQRRRCRLCADARAADHGRRLELSISLRSAILGTSRLRNQNGAIYLSAPLIYRADADQPLSTPVGFVLSRDRLITVRFDELTSFTTFADRTSRLKVPA